MSAHQMSLMFIERQDTRPAYGPFAKLRPAAPKPVSPLSEDEEKEMFAVVRRGTKDSLQAALQRHRRLLAALRGLHSQVRPSETLIFSIRNEIRDLEREILDLVCKLALFTHNDNLRAKGKPEVDRLTKGQRRAVVRAFKWPGKWPRNLADFDNARVWGNMPVVEGGIQHIDGIA